MRTVADLCREQSIDTAQLAARSGLDEGRVTAIALGRWTPSPNERQRIAAVFGVGSDEILASAEARHEYWRQKCEMHREFAAAQPNAGHKILASWEAGGRIRGVITQNIDGLHQLAGSKRVLALHGTALEAACLDCKSR